MVTSKRKTYAPEYRREAAHVVIDTGRTIAAAVREVDVGEQLLNLDRRWCNARRLHF